VRSDYRGNKRLWATSRHGGKTWSNLGKDAIEFAKKLQSGVAALNGMIRLTPKFAGLTIAPVKKQESAAAARSY